MMQLADFGHNFQPGCATIYIHISWLQQLNQKSDTVTSQTLLATRNTLSFNGLHQNPKNPASATKVSITGWLPDGYRFLLLGIRTKLAFFCGFSEDSEPVSSDMIVYSHNSTNGLWQKC